MGFFAGLLAWPGGTALAAASSANADRTIVNRDPAGTVDRTTVESRVESVEVHPRSGVVSATLSNGVVVRVRRMAPTAREQAGPDADQQPSQQQQWSAGKSQTQAPTRSESESVWQRRSLKPGEAYVTVAVNGAELLEHAGNRGVSVLAAAAFERDGVEGRIAVESVIMPDAFLIRFNGPGEQVEETLRWLARPEREGGALHAPAVPGAFGNSVLDESVFVKQRAGVIEQLTDPVYASRLEVFETIQRTMHGADGTKAGDIVGTDAGQQAEFDVRLRGVRVDELLRLRVEDARAWLARHAVEAPIEIGVAGDIAADRAIAMVASTFGELAPRTPVEASWRADARRVDGGAEDSDAWHPGDGEHGRRDTALAVTAVLQEDAGAHGGEAESDVTTAESAARGRGKTSRAWSATPPPPPPDVSPRTVIGFPGCDLSDVGRHRLLRSVAQVLTDEARERLVRSGAANDVTAEAMEFVASPGIAYRNSGFVALVAPGDAEQTRPIADEVFALMDELGAGGPTLESLARSARTLIEQAEAFDADPRSWSAILSRCGVRGIEVEALADAPGFYERLTPGMIAKTLREQAGERARFVVGVGK